jgi:hypothetical protein
MDAPFAAETKDTRLDQGRGAAIFRWGKYREEAVYVADLTYYFFRGAWSCCVSSVHSFL